MSAPEHKSDIGKRLDEARLGMTHGIDVLLQQAKAEIDRLHARLVSELVHKCFVCEEQDSPREGCDCVCCTIRRAELEVERLQAAATKVCWFDWSGNDADAVAAVDELRRVLDGEKR